jgi:DNA replication protein DnaC
MLITSNRSIAEWGHRVRRSVGRHLIATAILDHLLHHSHVLTIRGDSYRFRASERAV